VAVPGVGIAAEELAGAGPALEDGLHPVQPPAKATTISPAIARTIFMALDWVNFQRKTTSQESRLKDQGTEVIEKHEVGSDFPLSSPATHPYLAASFYGENQAVRRVAP
jgi:hypothetical protein